MHAFGFQFFQTFRTIESPTTVQFIVIVTFRHDAIPENFPGIVVVKGTDFVLQVSLDPLPAFRGDVLPPVFPAYLVQWYRDDSEKSGIPRAAERRGGYCNAAMVVEVDRQGDIFLQERFPEISDMPFKNLVDIEVVIELLLRAVATMCRIKRTEIVIRFTRASGVIIIVDVDVIPVIFDIVYTGSSVWVFNSVICSFTLSTSVSTLSTGALTLFMPLISPSVPGAKRCVTSPVS